MVQVEEKNAWRLESTTPSEWEFSVRPGAPNKHFIVDTDSHVNEPVDVYALGGLPDEYMHRIPRIEADAQGNQWRICEGSRPALVKPAAAVGGDKDSDGQTWSDRMEAEDQLRAEAAGTKNPDVRGLERRLHDAILDGIDAQVVFANRCLLSYSTHDVDFSREMCRAWNRWALDVYGDQMLRFSPMALIQPSVVDGAVEDIAWAASNGFRGIELPCKPTWGPREAGDLHYNDRSFDPIWAAAQDADLPITIHVATGRDPREASGPGGAIINLTIGSLSTTSEPLAYIIASGVFERFPTLRIGTVEAGIGWVPWLLESLDHATRAHHMWVKPVLQHLPSDYYRQNCFSTFIEDHAGLQLVRDFDLLDNVMWSSDYPHQEGSWPHSAEAIERQLGGFTDDEVAKIVGLNAARVFGFDPPPVR